jgi:transcriptional regulator with XRE-family HTH domain
MAEVSYTGEQLRRERRLAEVSVVKLAQALGVSRQTLWVLERRAVVPRHRAEAYLAAVRALTRQS